MSFFGIAFTPLQNNFYAYTLLPISVALYSFTGMAFDSSLCNEIQSCRENFISSECADYSTNENARSKIQTCSEENMSRSGLENMEEVLHHCGIVIKDDFIHSLVAFASLPTAVIENFNRHTEINKAALAYCEDKLGFTLWQAEDAKSGIIRDAKGKAVNFPQPDASKIKNLIHCQQSKSAELLNYSLPSLPNLEEIKAFILELNKARLCFKAEAQADIICPVISSLSIGVAAGFVLKRALILSAARAGLIGADIEKINNYKNYIRSISILKKEKHNAAHLDDLLSLVESPAIRRQLEKADIDIHQLQLGILDSDIGKIQAVWKANVLHVSKDSDELLNVLSGRGNSPASQAMKELMKESGMAGKTFFNPYLSNEEIRRTLNDNPILMGYMHEVPGMSSAIQDLNAGRITVRQFKTRMRSNMFHNGPDAGFWNTYGNNIVPDSLSKQDEAAKSFFKNTVFEREKNELGVIVPKYPGPISAEGVFHNFVDRLSQGTRGGMQKIFVELGGDALERNPRMKLSELKNIKGEKVGLSNLKEVMIGNPEKTLKQMNVLIEHIEELRKANKLTFDQAKLFEKFVKDGIKRLEQQTEVLKNHIKIESKEGIVQKITMNYVDDSGKSVSKVITDNSTAEEALQTMNEFMRMEESIHGDPVTQFVKTGNITVSPSGTAVAYGSFGFAYGLLAEMPVQCQKHSDPNPFREKKQPEMAK